MTACSAPSGGWKSAVTAAAGRAMAWSACASIAAGEGNPDRAVRLSDEGFCYRRFLGGNSSEYFRPGRNGYGGNRSCEGDPGNDSDASSWARQSARWESGPCHRSLYSYQLRTALALAIESPHIAVTYLPLACSGATISTGF